ncbi:MAG: lipoyl(octanoyl) transferase LipB [Acidobacteriota bacterium]
MPSVGNAAAGDSDLRVGVMTSSIEAGGAMCEVRDCGQMGYLQAFELQRELVEQRKRGEIADQLLYVEHPHVVTMGRNGHGENLLASPELLGRAGIDFQTTNRGGDVTYHGPGQVVCYPIFDLRDWKRDVVAYVRGLEDVLIGTLAAFGIEGSTVPGATGVWVARDVSGAALPQPAKVAAIGVHVSRWVTSHGFALNVDTDLSYFRYIVPCGLTKPVTSMQTLGCRASRAEVVDTLSGNFGRVFGRKIQTLN